MIINNIYIYIYILIIYIYIYIYLSICLGKVCRRPICYRISSHFNILAKRVNTDLGLETERHHIANFDVGGDESLASKSTF